MSGLLISAFLVGLLGGVHCLGMCGGVSSALALGVAPGSAPGRGRVMRLLPFLLGYNAGRILTYTAAGALIGGLGYLAGEALAEYRAWSWLRLAAGALMVAMGLYLAGWWMGLGALERAGARLWRRIQPLSRRLLPPPTPAHALGLGLLWGWLPCGLVYSALLASTAAGGWLEGAAVMLAFGLGTLPTVLAMGLAAGTFRPPVGLRRAAGALVIGFGLWTIGAVVAMPALGTHLSAPAPQPPALTGG